MKIILNLELPYVPRSKCGPVLGDVVGAGASIASTAMTNATNKSIANSQLDAQREENQLNRDYNTQEAEKARQFQQNMMQEQMNYQTQSWRDQQRSALALQVAGARDSGVNPQVLLSGGGVSASGGSASAPSGGSAPAASFSSGLSPVPYQAQSPAVAFAQVAQGISSLATAKEKGVNTLVLEKTIESMDVDMSYKKALTSAVKTHEALDSVELKHKDKLLVQQIEKGVVEMATMKEQGKLYAETAKIQDSIKKLNEQLSNYHGQQYELAKLQVASFAKDFQTMLDVRAAQVKESNAKAYEASENAKTSKAMRPLLVYGESLKNRILDKDALIKDSTVNETIIKIKSELARDTKLSEQQRKAAELELMSLNKLIESYKKNPSLEKWHRVVDYFNKNLPVLGPLLQIGSKL